MYRYLFIGLGGCCGALSRYFVSVWVARSAGAAFPFGTLVINLGGSFVIGFLFELFETLSLPPAYRSFLTIGFLGAFTTFSTFSLETVNLLRDGEAAYALANAVFSVAGGVLAVYFGTAAARLLMRGAG